MYLGDSLVGLWFFPPSTPGWSPEEGPLFPAWLLGRDGKPFSGQLMRFFFFFTEPQKKPGRINCRQQSSVLKTEERREKG